MDIDVNSGDLRLQDYLFSFKIMDEIRETPFSLEVRRLGIPVGENRKWERATTGTLTRHLSHQYSYAIGYCIQLVHILDSSNTPEKERIAILQKVLTYLQAEKLEEIRKLVFTLHDKHYK